MQNENQDQHDYTCDLCSESLTEKGRFLADQYLCDDCYIEKSPLAKRTKPIIRMTHWDTYAD